MFKISKLCYLICRGRSFLHVRMQENLEVNNPMYIQDDIDDEDIHLERAFPLQEKVIFKYFYIVIFILTVIFNSQVEILEIQYMIPFTVLEVVLR